MELIQNTQLPEDETSSYMIKKAESGVIPDALLRLGICKVLHDLANVELAPGGPKYFDTKQFINKQMRTCEEIADCTEKANDQHYELPADFFTLCLGDHYKYSCGYWPELESYEVSANPSTSLLKDVITGTSNMVRDFSKDKSVRKLLTQAEENMLKLTLERADVKENQCILDVGCGWGSAAIYTLEHFPGTKVVAVSNSFAQGDFIRERAEEKNLADRILVISCNIAYFDSTKYGAQIKRFLGGQSKFDRIYSIGMFEHMKNWEKLLNKLTEEWLEDDGKIFLDFFVHKSRAYTYETHNWMGKYFFSGGIMPVYDLVQQLDKTIGKTLEIEAAYKLNGRHYSKSSEAWLKLYDEEEEKIMKIFKAVYGEEDAKAWWNRWRIYFLSISELFRIREGAEWFTAHYLLRNIKSAESDDRQK